MNPYGKVSLSTIVNAYTRASGGIAKLSLAEQLRASIALGEERMKTREQIEQELNEGRAEVENELAEALGDKREAMVRIAHAREKLAKFPKLHVPRKSKPKVAPENESIAQRMERLALEDAPELNL